MVHFTDAAIIIPELLVLNKKKLHLQLVGLFSCGARKSGERLPK
jgi:hypothetical protein